MCGRVREGNSLVEPGGGLVFRYNGGTDYKTWGPQPYNARIESLNGYWKSYLKGYIQVYSFKEGKGWFTYSSADKFGQWNCTLAIVYNEHGFAIVTKPSKSTIIEPFHHRMPVLLREPDEFITTGKIVEIGYQRLIQIA